MIAVVMANIYLALGSNVGDSKEYIEQAIKLLSEKIDSIVRAPLYISKAVGYEDQADFVNTAVSGVSDMSPEELLAFVKGIEQAVGRIERFRNGPREIDIDIIFYDDLIMDDPALTIPHSRFAERDFVLRPLCDLAPDFVDPRSRRTLTILMSELPESQQVISGRLS